MAVKLRLMRMGKKKQPTYRVVAADGRSPRDGRFIEIVGTTSRAPEPSVVKIDNDKAVALAAEGRAADRARREAAGDLRRVGRVQGLAKSGKRPKPTTPSTTSKATTTSTMTTSSTTTTSSMTTPTTETTPTTSTASPQRRRVAVLEYLVRAVVDDPDVGRGRRSRGASRREPARDAWPRRHGPRHRQARPHRQSIRTVVRAAAVRDGVEVDVDFVD